MISNKSKIGVIGLGYVGLPLAVEFGKKFYTVGFDINISRVSSLNQFKDNSNEIKSSEIKKSKYLNITNHTQSLKNLDFYIVTVPTPVTKKMKPDMNPLKAVCLGLGPLIKKGSIIIFESTVYPGATEKFCVPIIEKASGKIWKKDFFVGYSPERIVPGSKTHTLTNIDKLVSGDLPVTLRKVQKLYSSIISSKTIVCQSIEVAEAAKVIENTQRDLNIAFINELSQMFNNMGIDTNAVLEAASTKWNFLSFSPGLVGGHCLSVDPYYLIESSKNKKYVPKLIQTSRKLNESMPKFIASKILKEFSHVKKNAVIDICVLGLTFKENCSDTRNSKIFEVMKILKNCNQHKIRIRPVDCHASPDAVLKEYDVKIFADLQKTKKFHCLFFAAPHNTYVENQQKIIDSHLRKGGIIFDLKNIISKKNSENFRVLTL